MLRLTSVSKIPRAAHRPRFSQLAWLRFSSSACPAGGHHSHEAGAPAAAASCKQLSYGLPLLWLSTHRPPLGKRQRSCPE